MSTLPGDPYIPRQLEVRFTLALNEKGELVDQWRAGFTRRVLWSSFVYAVSDYFFTLLPFFVIGITLWLGNQFTKFTLISDWPLAAAVLASQAVFRLLDSSGHLASISRKMNELTAAANFLLTLGQQDNIENVATSPKFQLSLRHFATGARGLALMAFFIVLIPSLVSIVVMLTTDTYPAWAGQLNIYLFVLASINALISGTTARAIDDLSAKIDISELFLHQITTGFAKSAFSQRSDGSLPNNKISPEGVADCSGE